jgi:hypothetical protein
MSLLTGIMNAIECNPGCGLWLSVYHHNNRWCCQIYSKNGDGVELAFELSNRDEDYILTGIEQVLMLIELITESEDEQS